MSEVSQYMMTTFAAHYPLNTFMAALDMRPSFKWYVETHEVVFSTSTKVDAAYFLNIIEKSKINYKDQGFWIPAIKYQNQIFMDPEVKILSDGVKEVFVTREKPVSEVLPPTEASKEDAPENISKKSNTSRKRRSLKR